MGCAQSRNIKNNITSSKDFIDDDIYELFECIYDHQVVLNKLESDNKPVHWRSYKQR